MIAVAHNSAREDLLSEAGTVRFVPTLNSITNRMLRIVQDPGSAFSQLFDIVRYDPGFSAKVISIANSAYYSRTRDTLNLQRAFQSIGLKELRSILTCLTLLQDTSDQRRLCQGDLAAIWTHSLAVSYAARILSRRLMVEDPEEVFIVSLLHDIGKGILYTQDDRYRDVVREANETGRDLCSLEREAFGTDHQEAGECLSTKWGFPEKLAAVIRGHHTKAGGENMLLHLVRVADAFIEDRRLDAGPEAIILENEKDYIISEVRRIGDLLGVDASAIAEYKER